MSVRRPWWTFAVPTTFSSKARTVSVVAPTILFGISTAAIITKQSLYRNSLADENETTHDRIDRRAYVALPDGRMALVHPRIDARLSLGTIWSSLTEAFNPLP